MATARRHGAHVVLLVPPVSSVLVADSVRAAAAASSGCTRGFRDALPRRHRQAARGSPTLTAPEAGVSRGSALGRPDRGRATPWLCTGAHVVRMPRLGMALVRLGGLLEPGVRRQPEHGVPVRRCSVAGAPQGRHRFRLIGHIIRALRRLARPAPAANIFSASTASGVRCALGTDDVLVSAASACGPDSSSVREGASWRLN